MKPHQLLRLAEGPTACLPESQHAFNLRQEQLIRHQEGTDLPQHTARQCDQASLRLCLSPTGTGQELTQAQVGRVTKLYLQALWRPWLAAWVAKDRPQALVARLARRRLRTRFLLQKKPRSQVRLHWHHQWDGLQRGSGEFTAPKLISTKTIFSLSQALVALRTKTCL